MRSAAESAYRTNSVRKSGENDGVRLAKARKMGRFGWALVAFWLGSGLGAVVASRFHVF